MTVTGVRWAESTNRKANQGLVTLYGKNKDIMANINENINFLRTNRGGWY